MTRNSLFRRTLILALAITGVTFAADTPPADPVPHALITQPYRVCDDLEELTARINNLYRKPFDKLFDAAGNGQPETIFFKDVTSGHEVMSLTRELCTDIAHADLGRPVWTVDGRRIMFMGNRALIDNTGKLKVSNWQGKMYTMNADYSDQRAMIVEMLDEQGNSLGKADGMPGKYNIMDPTDSHLAYYASEDKLFKVILSDDDQPSKAQQIATFSNKQRKIIQAISRDRKLLIQDLNADPDYKTKKLPYMPEIHVIDLNKQPNEPGFYYHHPMDYGLADVKDPGGKLLHDAKNNYQFHSLMFAGNNSNMIGWNYGPMTQEGEFLGWSLDITNGLDGTPQHGEVLAGAGGNPFSQYESHGRFVGDTTIGLYYSGPATVGGQKVGEYGLFMRDYEKGTPPIFVTPAPGGHVAGGESFNPFYFASHIQASTAEWRKRIPASDALWFGDVREPEKSGILCYTYSDVRGGTKTDRKTGKTVWSGMDNNDFRPYTAIPRPLFSRDSTKVWFHSSMLMPTEDWTGIYVVTVRRPDAPTDLAATKAANGVTLTWKPAANAVETKGYHVYRTIGSEAPVDLTPKTVPARDDAHKMIDSVTFTDIEAPDKPCKYFVTAEEWSTLESDTTSNVIAWSGGSGTSEPAITGFDKVAPPTPANFTATAEADAKGQYRLKWDASPATDVRYYNVYFSQKDKPEVSQKRLITSPLASMKEYLDWSAPLDGPANYAITAVDRQGNESAPAFANVP